MIYRGPGRPPKLNKKSRQQINQENYRRRKEKLKVRQSESCISRPIPSKRKIEERRNPEHLILSSPCVVKDFTGGILVQCFQNVIPSEMLDTLQASTDHLLHDFPIATRTNSRGKTRAHTFGTWRESADHPFQTGNTNSGPALEWILFNGGLIGLLDELFKKSFPALHKEYYNAIADIETETFGAWANITVNHNFACKPHRDKKDFYHGLCWVIPFGSWTGGNICFKEIDVEVKLNSSDVICFASAKLTHWVQSYIGERNSLVLFTHHSMFYPICNTEIQNQ